MRSVTRATFLLTLVAFGAVFATGVLVSRAQDQSEPIAAVGHGALFDSSGNQIDVTPEFIAKSQSWYEKSLLQTAKPEHRKAYEGVRRSLTNGLQLDEIDRLLASQAALIFLAESQGSAVNPRTIGKLRAVEYRLRISAKKSENSFLLRKSPVANQELIKRLEKLRRPSSALKMTTIVGAPGTNNSGKAYSDECAAAQVPVPPPINVLDPTGKSGWRSEGYLPGDRQFIVNTLAEVRTFENAQGLCYALPRYLDDSKSTVIIDGVICLSKVTSKVCFWDNQMNTVPFEFSPTERIPIGFPDTSVDPKGRYQAGGAELEGGDGGVCTDCHAGENPYVVHPRVDLGGGITWATLQGRLGAFGAEFYKPIVPASWPQNETPSTSTPKACGGCHSQDGDGGRLPQPSKALKFYCSTVLRLAIEGGRTGQGVDVPATMPPRTPGSATGHADVQAFRQFCNS